MILRKKETEENRNVNGQLIDIHKGISPGKNICILVVHTL